MPLLFLLLLLPFGMAPKADALSNYLFTGATYSEASGGKAFAFNVGVAHHLGAGIYTAPRAVAGSYGSLEVDQIKFFQLGDSWRFGAVAGPSVDWTVEGDDTDPTTYITAASGVVIGYMPSGPDKLGVFLAGKYKFDFESETMFHDGWEVAIELAYGW